MTISNAVKKHNNPSYEAKSDSPISSKELNILFDYCFSSPNIYKLQFWVLVLISICLFLRGDETVDIRFFSI